MASPSSSLSSRAATGGISDLKPAAEHYPWEAVYPKDLDWCAEIPVN